MREISGHTSRVGLLGWPLEHSLSPAMHNAAFAALDMDWVYLPLPVRPGQVEPALRGLVALLFVGCNVTIPHKRAVVPYLDEVSEEARAVGAVNTIQIRDGRLLGSNTDPAGFLRSLEEGGYDAAGKRVLVLGAGGAARAVVYGLASAGAGSVVVVNRSLARATELVGAMAGLFPPDGLRPEQLSRDTLRRLGDEADLVVNATPLGTVPQVEASPWPGDLAMPGHAHFYDLVYNPLETALLARARAAGAAGTGGLDMLVHQGALAFTRWTGRQAPVETMREACLKALGAR